MSLRGRGVLGIVGAVVAVVALGASPRAGAAGELPRVGWSGGLGVDVASDGWAARIDEEHPLAVRLAAPGAPFGLPVTVEANGGYLAPGQLQVGTPAGSARRNSSPTGSA